jgi:DNA-binding XRE family transcriptional regulator
MSFYVDFFKEIRRRHKLSIQDLAFVLGVTRQNMYQIELGTYKPSQKLIDKACQIFDVEIEQKFKFKNEAIK